MKILIDADGCPVVDLAIKVSKIYNIEVIILCDTSHEISRENVQTVIASKGADSVDFVIVKNIKKGDIIITQDYGLACMALSMGGICINQNGLEYTNSNIDELLMQRHLAKKFRNSGGRTKGPKKRQTEDDQKFLTGFEKIVVREVGVI